MEKQIKELRAIRKSESGKPIFVFEDKKIGIVNQWEFRQFNDVMTFGLVKRTAKGFHFESWLANKNVEIFISNREVEIIYEL